MESTCKTQIHSKKKPLYRLDLNDELANLIDYKYNENGELLNKKTKKKCGKLSSDEYLLVGLYVERYIENFLTSELKMKTLYLPNDSLNLETRDISQPQCKILITENFETSPKCMLLIQGTGAVRLGQWARSVCINDNLNLGSMVPYVRKAKNLNFSVVIFNPNERSDFENNKKLIPEFDCMENHCLYVYGNVIKKNKNIKEIYIVAHSMGGVCTMEILKNNLEDLESGKIKKIAFTDSVHSKSSKLGKKGGEKFVLISRNYIRSDKPLGTFLKSYKKSYGGTDCYSSGHSKHEYTTGTAIEDVFKFFNK